MHYAWIESFAFFLEFYLRGLLQKQRILFYYIVSQRQRQMVVWQQNTAINIKFHFVPTQ